eukprot:808075-Rhodomonas_salina.1
MTDCRFHLARNSLPFETRHTTAENKLHGAPVMPICPIHHGRDAQTAHEDPVAHCRFVQQAHTEREVEPFITGDQRLFQMKKDTKKTAALLTS